jgi:hypothetical protein
MLSITCYTVFYRIDIQLIIRNQCLEYKYFYHFLQPTFRNCLIGPNIQHKKINVQLILVENILSLQGLKLLAGNP